MTPILLVTALYGSTPAIARDVTADGLVAELALPLPLGSTVLVCFTCCRTAHPYAHDELRVQATVQRTYCLNAGGPAGPVAVRAVGLRFSDFEDGDSTSIIDAH